MFPNFNGLVGSYGINPTPNQTGNPRGFLGRLGSRMGSNLKSPEFYQRLGQVLQRPRPSPQPQVISSPQFGGTQLFNNPTGIAPVRRASIDNSLF